MVGLGLGRAQDLLVSLLLRLLSFSQCNTLPSVNCGCGQWGALTILRRKESGVIVVSSLVSSGSIHIVELMRSLNNVNLIQSLAHVNAQQNFF